MNYLHTEEEKKELGIGVQKFDYKQMQDYIKECSFIKQLSCAVSEKAESESEVYVSSILGLEDGDEKEQLKQSFQEVFYEEVIHHL